MPWANWLVQSIMVCRTTITCRGAVVEVTSLFIGRSCPEKRLDRAIEIAGVPLKIAAKVDKADRAYHETKIKIRQRRYRSVYGVGDGRSRKADRRLARRVHGALLCDPGCRLAGRYRDNRALYTRDLLVPKPVSSAFLVG